MGWWKPPPAGSRRHGYRPRWPPLAPRRRHRDRRVRRRARRDRRRVRRAGAVTPAPLTPRRRDRRMGGRDPPGHGWHPGPFVPLHTRFDPISPHAPSKLRAESYGSPSPPPLRARSAGLARSVTTSAGRHRRRPRCHFGWHPQPKCRMAVGHAAGPRKPSRRRCQDRALAAARRCE